MHTRGDSMVDDRVAAHEEIVRMARKKYPESLEAAKARTYHIRIVCLNAILDCPHFRTHPSWKRHIRELRERLPDLLRTKHPFWLPTQPQGLTPSAVRLPGSGPRVWIAYASASGAGSGV